MWETLAFQDFQAENGAHWPDRTQSQRKNACPFVE